MERVERKPLTSIEKHRHSDYKSRGSYSMGGVIGSTKGRIPTSVASSGASVVESSNRLLSGLPRALFDAIRPSLRTVYLVKEQFLFQQDDRVDYVYFPDTVVVSEFRILEDGRMVEIAITGREGVVGVSTLFCSSVAANCTQVSQAGSALQIETTVFLKFLRINPDLSKFFNPYVDSYIRQISQKAICNVYHSVEERFCKWLLMLDDRCGKSTLSLTHEQIARALGVYRPSVTYIALDMRKKKLINYSRGGVSICDRRRLEEFACGCYAELKSNTRTRF